MRRRERDSPQSCVFSSLYVSIPHHRSKEKIIVFMKIRKISNYTVTDCLAALVFARGFGVVNDCSDKKTLRAYLPLVLPMGLYHAPCTV